MRRQILKKMDRTELVQVANAMLQKLDPSFSEISAKEIEDNIKEEASFVNSGV